MHRERGVGIVGTPDIRRIADALSVILSERYRAEITVTAKKGEHNGNVSVYRDGGQEAESLFLLQY